jgi:hypothetical protein
MTTEPQPEDVDPLVPNLNTPGAFYWAASAGPARSRALPGVAEERHWGLCDYHKAAAVREHAQGEASGDRDPSPDGPAAREMSLHLGVFSAPVSEYAVAGPGYMHGLATEWPAFARSPEATESDRSAGWPAYKTAATMRQAARGEADGDRDPTPPAPGSAGREVAHFISVGAPAAGTASYPEGQLYDMAAAGPACSRGGDWDSAFFGWLDYKQAALAREVTRGEGEGETQRAARLDADREAC